MLEGQRVAKEFNSRMIYGTITSTEGDNSYADDPSAETYHQYGDCAVRWDGRNHDLWEWSAELTSIRPETARGVK